MSGNGPGPHHPLPTSRGSRIVEGPQLQIDARHVHGAVEHRDRCDDAAVGARLAAIPTLLCTDQGLAPAQAPRAIAIELRRIGTTCSAPGRIDPH
jgi:hypothetical protein